MDGSARRVRTVAAMAVVGAELASLARLEAAVARHGTALEQLRAGWRTRSPPPNGRVRPPSASGPPGARNTNRRCAGSRPLCTKPPLKSRDGAPRSKRRARESGGSPELRAPPRCSTIAASRLDSAADILATRAATASWAGPAADRFRLLMVERRNEMRLGADALRDAAHAMRAMAAAV